ncbi:hypothetical protein GCM10020254_01000 [Streptomyces goshikiensis]
MPSRRPLERVVAQGPSVDQDRPAGGFVEPGQQLDQGGLPGAVAAHESGAGAGGHGEGDAVEDGFALSRVGEGDLAELDALRQYGRQGERALPDGGFGHVQEAEQVPQEEPVLVELDAAGEQGGHGGLDDGDARDVSGERTDLPGVQRGPHGQQDGGGGGAGAEQSQQGGPPGLAVLYPPVGGVEVVGEPP